MPAAIHQLLPTLGYGDAIGNHVLALQARFRAWGFRSEIFAERWHPKLEKYCRPYTEYRRVQHAGNLALLHYSIGGEINDFAQTLPDRVLLYYHNITPAHYFYRVNGELARQLQQARTALAQLATRFPAIAASAYNAAELRAMGFAVLGVAPYWVRFDDLDAGLRSPGADAIRARYGEWSGTTWLYIGRLAPNKCIHDAINAFYYYHAWMQPASRLILVGTGEGLQPYVDSLYRQVTRLGLDGAVAFAGHYAAADGLAAFYEMADVYVSMSEHEGFCIPLVEAMHYDVPVVAHAATGVPDTLGDAGILIKQKTPAVIAEMIHELLTAEDLRAAIVAGQRARLAAFAPARAQAALAAVLAQAGVTLPESG